MDDLETLRRESETPAGADATADAATLASGPREGLPGARAAVGREDPSRYRILRELARGGQGVVFVAWDAQLGREVAIKQLLAARTGGGSGDDLSPGELRFLRESRITAQLDHPGIAPVYEVARRADGSLFTAQKLVRGRTLAEALAACGPLRERLGLLQPLLGLCQAVAFAHGRGVIHRDLKPGNMMIGDLGEAIVLDWGLARSGDESSAEPQGAAPETPPPSGDASRTRDGAVLGTPHYMSPEQAAGASARVDARSDVWSLGVILYELLTGARPFEGKTGAAVMQAVSLAPLRRVQERCPEAPAELAAVAERALARDPAERYPSAKEFADELSAWLSGERVVAHEYGSWELLRRFVGRHRAVVALSGALLLLGAAAAVQTFRQLLEARRTLAVAHAAQARQAQAEYRWADARRWFAAAVAEDPSPALRFEAAIDWTDLSRLEQFDLQSRWVTSADWSPDGRTVATSNIDGLISLRDARTLEELRSIDAGAEAMGQTGQTLAWSPDGRYLVAGLGDRTLRAWEAASGRVTAVVRLQSSVAGLALSPGGEFVAAVQTGGEVRLYDFAGGELREREWKGEGTRTCFSPDGKTLAVALSGEGGETRLLLHDLADLDHPRTLASGQRGMGRPRFLPDGSLITAGRGVVIRWDPATGKELRRADERTATMAINGVALSRDGRTYAVGGSEGVFALDAQTLELISSARVPARVVHLAFSPDGEELLLATIGRSLLRWRPRPRLAIDGSVAEAAFLPGGHRVAVADAAGVRLFDGDNGRELAKSPGATARVAVAAIEPGRLAVVREGGSVEVLRSSDLSLEVAALAPAPADAAEPKPVAQGAIALSPDGGRLFVSREDGVAAFDLPSRALVWRRPAAGRRWTWFAGQPTATRLVVAGDDGLVLLDAADGRTVASLPAARNGYGEVSGRILLGLARERYQVLDPATGFVEKVLSIAGAEGSLAGHPRAALLANGGNDGTLRLFDAATGRLLVERSAPALIGLPVHGFSSDGALMLVGHLGRGGLSVVRFGAPPP